jgi:hypothetical protein
MRTRLCVTFVFDNAPLTGGSGGGGPNKGIWGHPEPQSILGYNSTFVYGTNAQIACPVNFQLAFGSNLQLCINPIAFQTLCGDAGTTQNAEYQSWLGSGQGGNMQFTMGTSANFVMGQIYDINIGPRRITIDIHALTMAGTASKALGLALIIVVAVFVLGYAFIPDDDLRALFVGVFQITVGVFLINLMDLQGLYRAMDEKGKKAINETFGADVDPPKDAKAIVLDTLARLAAGVPPPPESAFLAALEAAETDEGKATAQHLACAGVAIAWIIPGILIIIGETRLSHPEENPNATGFDTF